MTTDTTTSGPLRALLRVCCGRPRPSVHLALTVALSALPLVGQEHVVVRSGPGLGITVLSGPHSSPLRSAAFSSADFQAAANGADATLISAPNGGWMATLPADPQARWMGLSATGTPGSFLLSQPFVIDSCELADARMVFSFAVDDTLGDPGPSPANPVGVFLNGVPVPGMSGAGFATQTTVVAGVGGMLQPGDNVLQVYCRDTARVVAGVMYSARICFMPCRAEELVSLRSGNGQIGSLDSQIRSASVSGAALAAADFSNAEVGPFAWIAGTTPVSGCGPLAADAAAQPVLCQQIGQHRILFCQPFTFTACNLIGARLHLDYHANDRLGSPAGTPNVGIWLNGQPVPGSFANGGCDLAFDAIVSPSLLQPGAVNHLFLYLENQPNVLGMPPIPTWSAKLRIRSCAPVQQIVVRSGPGVTLLAGPSGTPLRPAQFTPADFAACTTPAAVVTPHPAWCQSIPGSSAQWVARTTSRTPASILFAQTFQVGGCDGSLSRAVLHLRFAVDDHLGDHGAGGSNPEGIWINGQPVAAAWSSVGGGTCSEFTRDISGLLHVGTNTLYFYDRDVANIVSGAIWEAVIQLASCRRPALGIGCVATSARLSCSLPYLGGVFDLRLEGLSPTVPLAILGLGGPMPGGPLDLAAAGAPGCMAAVDPALTMLTLPAGTASATFQLAVPADPALLGIALLAQAALADPDVNAAGFATTAAIGITIGQ